MDFGEDLINLANQAAGCPTLSPAYNSAIGILLIVQRMRENKATFQYLAHLVATSVIEISQYMPVNWDAAGATPYVKSRLETFLKTLEEIHQFFVQQSSSSVLPALFSSYGHHGTIQRLKERLGDARLSLLISLGVEAAHTSSLVETMNDALAIISKDAPGHIPDHDLLSYTSQDFLFLSHIIDYSLRSRKESDNTIHVTLDKVKRAADGTICIVKSYQGHKSTLKEDEIKRDIAIRKSFRHPSFLQLIGASSYTTLLPFQVYYAPESNEPIRSWIARTLTSNPVETLCGLYDMRKSVMAIQDFESHVSLEGDLGRNLLVNVTKSGFKLIWKAVYAGELSSTIDKPSTQMYDRIVTSSIIPHWFDPGQKYQEFFEDQHSPEAIVDHFCRGISYSNWSSDQRTLEDLVRSDYSTINISMLENAFAEEAWFAPTKAWMPHGTFLRLGDVGYLTHEGDFRVIGNIHKLSSTIVKTNTESHTMGSTCMPPWECYYHFSESPRQDPVTCKDAGNREYQELSYQAAFPSKKYLFLKLTYTNFNQKSLQTGLKEHAPAIISQAGLAIGPHSLKLVISVVYEWWLTLDTTEPTTNSSEVETGPNLHPQGKLSHHVVQSPEVINKVQHPLFAFIRGGGLEVEETGIPGIRQPILKLSLNRSSPCLQDDTWNLQFGNDIAATKDGDTLSLGYTLYQSIHHIQLPINRSLH